MGQPLNCGASLGWKLRAWVSTDRCGVGEWVGAGRFGDMVEWLSVEIHCLISIMILPQNSHVDELARKS
jgi:hypothetical protein